MTPNQNVAHSTAYADTHKLRTAVARASAVHRLAKIAYDEVEAQCNEAYHAIYAETLARLTEEQR